jgi:hypothetical protein
MQVVGKVRLELSPFLNHWWHVTLYVTTRGLATSSIPYHGGIFDVTFDFVEHMLFIRTSEGTTRALPLIPRSVASFYREFMDCLHALGIEVTINTLPNEVQNPIRCDIDEVHSSYDPVYAQRFWHILVQVQTVFRHYRSHFMGKSSPVHFFWGSFDLAVTLFSGQRAPEHPGVDRITHEAYSHEEISCGFWPGSDTFPAPAFYSYTIQHRPDSRPQRFARKRRSIVKNWENSSCAMTTCEQPPHRSRCCWSFARVPMKQGLGFHIGIVSRSKGRPCKMKKRGDLEWRRNHFAFWR